MSLKSATMIVVVAVAAAAFDVAAAAVIAAASPAAPAAGAATAARAMTSAAAAAAAPPPPQLNRTGGKAFDGLGGLSSSTAGTLYDYPAASRERILDLLFEPRLGAAVQILKVEIPGDVQSTVQSEPSHMHSRTDLSYDRGVEYKLMAAARQRNPAVKLYALQWSTPAWVSSNGHSTFTEQNINYTLSWLHGARAAWNITAIEFLGFWNEQAEPSNAYILRMRAALDANGWVGTKLIGLDSSWDERFFQQVTSSPEASAAIFALGVHAPPDCPRGPAGCKGKPLIPSWSALPEEKRPLLWASEDGNLPCDLAGVTDLGKINRPSHGRQHLF